MAVGPTYPELRDATFRSFKAIAASLGLLIGINKTEFHATVRTFCGGDAEILFRSGDDPDRLRGPNISGLWIDEASLVAHEAYLVALACLREGGDMGWTSATFTPKGKSHWTYKTFVRDDSGSPPADAALIHAKTSQNPFLSERFYDTLTNQYGDGLRALQELEGEFVDVEGAEWPGSYFGSEIWFDEWPTNWQCRTAALDPSKGRDAKHGDYSAIVTAMMDQHGVVYIDADLARRDTKLIVESCLETQRQFRADLFGVETNQFQELLADQIAVTSQERGLMLPIVPLDNRVNKEVRIRRLTPYLARGLLRFKADSPGAQLLVQQLRDFPEGEHDDGPDALEMALRLIGQLLNTAPETEEYLDLGM